MIDSDLKMWLLEINLCPTMEHSTKVTAHLVPKMTDDLVKVIIDSKDNEGCGKKGTGNFELIYESQKIKDAPDFRSKNEISIEGTRILK